MTSLPFLRVISRLLVLCLLPAVLFVSAPSFEARAMPGATLAPVSLPARAGVLPVKLTFPALSGRVVDDAHVLIPETRDDLERTLEATEARTGNQVVVVTLPSLQGDAIDDYGYQLGRKWGIGRTGKNNGVLIIVVPSEKAARIEVGYGLEPVLTDAATSNILHTVMLPAFRDGNIDQGIIDGANAVLAALSEAEVKVQRPAPPPGGGDAPLTPLQIVGGVILMIFLLWLSIEHPQLAWFLFRLALMFASSSSGKGGFRGGGGSFGGGGASGSW